MNDDVDFKQIALAYAHALAAMRDAYYAVVWNDRRDGAMLADIALKFISELPAGAIVALKEYADSRNEAQS